VLRKDLKKDAFTRKPAFKALQRSFVRKVFRRLKSLRYWRIKFPQIEFKNKVFG
jgi:hypothetical protein